MPAPIAIHRSGTYDGENSIVILGPNGSGKTQLAQQISRDNAVTAISAQRRTWVDESLPVQAEQQLRSQVHQAQAQWQHHSWQPTEDINFILSTLIQEHTSLLTYNNDQAILCGTAVKPVTNTKLMQLQKLWGRLFPKRKLEIGGFFPKVKRLDADPQSEPYQLRQMSDGERTVLYMAARVLTAEHPVILVDEPELHMHSRLSILFWDAVEKIRQDCRFIYVTHDLNFALSRRRATYLVCRSDDSIQAALLDDLPSSVAADVLGAATLPFYAKRIIFFEGEPGKGFASEFFSAWFDDDETFAIPAGARSSVCAAVLGLKAVGVAGAEVLGLVDRDFYPDSVLCSVPAEVRVLSLHEIESVLCDKSLVGDVALHLGKDPDEVWLEFLQRVRKEFQGKTLNAVVAHRVRARVGDLLDGAFKGSQIDFEFNQTIENHEKALAALGLQTKTGEIGRASCRERV